MKYNEERDEMQVNEKTESLNRKDYLLTVYQRGDEGMSFGNLDRQVLPKRFWTACSLNEIGEYIEMMKTGFWTHPDMDNPKVNHDDIPYDEKKFGQYYNLTIEPLDEQLEKEYMKASEDGFFEMQRLALKRKENQMEVK